MINQEQETYTDNPTFMEFVLREAEATLVHATVEELAMFGFGSIEAAIEAFKQQEQQTEKSNEI
jgi:hypothetical protein